MASNQRNGPDRLLYKDDWPQARQRFLAFWEGEIIDRACIYVTAPRPNPQPLPIPPDLESKYADVDYLLARTNAEMANTYYGGEAVPVGRSCLGYLAYGGKPVFDETTIWVPPILHDWRQIYRFDPQKRWCRRFLEIIKALIADGHGDGKYVVETAGMHHPTDALLTLRGAENLCMDLVAHPDAVREWQAELMRGYKWILDECYTTIPDDHGWLCRWMWAPGRLSMAACDFSAMIGPEHFREFVVPEIERIAQSLDYCVYHLDGASTLQHLPALLEIDALDGIQWARGATDIANGTALNWVPLCRQVQAAGKTMNIEVKIEDVEPLLKEVDPRRMFIRTSAPSIEAADTLLKNAGRWSCSGAVPIPPGIHKEKQDIQVGDE